jgi:hypothetical protein
MKRLIKQAAGVEPKKEWRKKLKMAGSSAHH